MADEKHNLASPFSKRVQIEVPKLGWLSSYTRQILLSRHALRTFFIMMDYVARETAKPSRFDAIGAGQDTLTHLRALIEILSGSNKRTLRLSAPYAPLDRPQKFFLGEARKGHLFSVVIKQTEAFESKGTTFAVNGLATKNSFTWIGQDNEGMSIDILAQEIEIVRKGVSLSNKSVADERCDELISKPLWPEGTGRVWQSAELFQPLSSTFADSFTFWREWYQGFLDGKPLDWELQRRVALIPDEDWEKGPEHIAEIIEKIRLQFKTQTTPPLVRDEEREIFTVESDDTLSRDVLEFACTRITIAYDAAIDASSENGFREDSYEASLIQRALAEFATHPSLLATSFFDACLSFQRTIGERYPEDTSLLNLRNALYGVVEEINEQHEDARNRCARLAKLAQPEPISVDDMQVLKEVPDMVADQVDTHAGQIIESDVERMLSTPNPPKSVRARFTNWITTISMWMDKAMKGDKRAQWLAGLVGRLIKWFPGSE